MRKVILILPAVIILFVKCSSKKEEPQITAVAEKQQESIIEKIEPKDRLDTLISEVIDSIGGETLSFDQMRRAKNSYSFYPTYRLKDFYEGWKVRSYRCSVSFVDKDTLILDTVCYNCGGELEGEMKVFRHLLKKGTFTIKTSEGGYIGVYAFKKAKEVLLHQLRLDWRDQVPSGNASITEGEFIGVYAYDKKKR